MPDHLSQDPPEPRPMVNTMQGIHFHDPDGQHWLELEKLELGKREHILPVTRDGFTLPNGPNTLIYPGKEGPTNGLIR